jgi:hypothetical protein
MGIQGLRWEDNWSIPNGGESKVLPIPTLRPPTIVYHGDDDSPTVTTAFTSARRTF